MERKKEAEKLSGKVSGMLSPSSEPASSRYGSKKFSMGYQVDLMNVLQEDKALPGPDLDSEIVLGTKKKKNSSSCYKNVKVFNYRDRHAMNYR